MLTGQLAPSGKRREMKCVICKSGVAAPGTTTVVMERGKCAIVFRDVPAAICQNCGEAYVNDNVASSLLARAEQTVANGTELEIVRFAA